MSREAITKRDCAKYLMRHMNAIDLSIGAMIDALGGSDLADREAMQRALFKVVDDLHVGIALPNASEYPDLHPDKEQ